MTAAKQSPGRRFPPASAAASPRDPDPLSMRVLLVEDDPFQALAYQRGLMEGGAAVDLASTAAEGLHLSAVNLYDLIVADRGLPDMEGLELCQVFKARSPRTPILLISADDGEQMVNEALRIGVEDFLGKPITSGDLEQRVLRLAERRIIADAAGRRTVLAIGAHPDDQEVGVGGTLLRHARDGDRVVLLTLTGGGARGRESGVARQAREAANILGASLILGSLTETELPEGNPTVRLIEEAITRYRPAVVYTHTRHDRNPDHRSVHRATMAAAAGVPEVYCYRGPSTTPQFRPSHYTDIDRLIAVKQRAIVAYASRGEWLSYRQPERVDAMARSWGRLTETGAAEPLEVVRPSGVTPC